MERDSFRKFRVRLVRYKRSLFTCYGIRLLYNIRQFFRQEQVSFIVYCLLLGAILLVYHKSLQVYLVHRLKRKWY